MGCARGVTALGVPDELIHRIGWGVDTRVRYTGERDRSLVDTIFPGRPVVASPRLHKQLYNLDVIMDGDPAGAASGCPRRPSSSWPTASRPTRCARRQSGWA